jgi:amidohydrolase
MIKERIQLIAEEIFNDVVGNRRHLHTNPELSFQEVATSAFVASKLDELEIPYVRMADNGLVGLIVGNKPSDRVVALRADMDALPITETSDVPYKSQNVGVMHACGHDAHTSSLLGTATILSRIKNDFAGTVKLIFQPAEEKLPGGANLMIQQGVLEIRNHRQ